MNNTIPPTSGDDHGELVYGEGERLPGEAPQARGTSVGNPINDLSEADREKLYEQVGAGLTDGQRRELAAACGEPLFAYCRNRQATARRVGVTLERLDGERRRFFENSVASDFATVRDEIGELSAADYAQLRKPLAEVLDVRPSDVDAIRREVRGEGNGAALQGRAMMFNEPEPWPDEVDGVGLLDELCATFKRYVVMPQHAPETSAAWELFAHAQDCFYFSPYLVFTSPQRECGKTLALRVFSTLIPRPKWASRDSVAVLFRCLDKYACSMLFDEQDGRMQDNPELLHILNSAFERDGAVVSRCEGDAFELREFRTFGPKLLGLIGALPDTLQSRAIVIHMKRKRENEVIEEFRPDKAGYFLELKRKAARWALDNADVLRASDPEVPAGLFNRTADVWRPMLAVAEVCGGDWPEKMREAAIALSETQDVGSIGEILLADIETIFKAKNVDRLSSADIVANLNTMEDRIWPGWAHGKGLSTNALARQLRDFRIVPTTLRLGGTTAKGYHKTAFEDSWARYGVSDRNTVTTQEISISPGENNRNTESGCYGSESPENEQNQGLLRCYGSEGCEGRESDLFEPETRTEPERDDDPDAGCNPIERETRRRWRTGTFHK